jgi:hypothetical protein
MAPARISAIGLCGAMMSEETKPFWRLDLTKLTPAGRLLIAASIASVLGATILLLLLLEAIGLRHDPYNLGAKPWYEKVALLAALGVGFGVFELGRRVLAPFGFPVTHPPKDTR